MSTVTVIPRNHLLAFVALKHVEQKRKYTNEPYLFHLQAVAKMADEKCSFGYEIGLCHDLFEDTDCGSIELQQALYRFGYSINDAEFIFKGAMELTDVYIPENFPQLNRAKRKSLEVDRLHKISYEAQTVKYCDLINNTESIVKYDPGFAVKYLEEKKAILSGMVKGNPVMFQKCKRVLRKALKTLAVLS